MDYDNESNFNHDKNNSFSKKNSDNSNTYISNNSNQQKFNYDNISYSNINLNNNNNDLTIYKEQKLANYQNYQIKRSESNNFGNLNNDYSRFSDNRNISVQFNNNANQLNNENNFNYHYNYNNNNLQNQNLHMKNNPQSNNQNINLRINTINSTNRSYDIANEKSVLISPHFNQMNTLDVFSNQYNHQQFINNNSTAMKQNQNINFEKENPSRRGMYDKILNLLNIYLIIKKKIFGTKI